MAAATLVVVLAAVFREPSFYADRLPVGGPLEGRSAAAAALAAEHDARRLVTRAAAVHSSLATLGRWEAVIDERQLNAWLAVDLPRNHAGILPAMVREPRVQLLPGRVRLAARLGPGPLVATGWLEAEVRLLAANQLAITVGDARLGILPVPRGPVLREIGRRLERLGAVVQPRRLGDRPALVMYIFPETGASGTVRWLESFAIVSGEVAFAGETRGRGAEAAAR